MSDILIIERNLPILVQEPDSQVVVLGQAGPPGPPGTTDHGALIGIGDDDHPQYILVDGTRAFTGSVTVNTGRLETPIGVNHIFGSASRDALRLIHDVVPGSGIELASTDSTGGVSFEPLTIRADGTALFGGLTVTTGDLTVSAGQIICTGNQIKHISGEANFRLQATNPAGRVYDLISGGGGSVSAGVWAIRDQTVGSNRLEIDASGNVRVPVGNLTISAGQILPFTGTKAAPGISWSGDGFFQRVDGFIMVGIDGQELMQLQGAGIAVGNSAGTAGFSISGNVLDVAGPDVFLLRDAANILALRNGDAVQEFRVWGAVTGAKYAAFGHNAADALLQSSFGGFRFSGVSGNAVGPTVALHNLLDSGTATSSWRTGYFGTSVVASRIGSPVATDLQFSAGDGGVGTAHWAVLAAGAHFGPISGDVRDLGSSGIPVRTGYFGTSVRAPLVQTDGATDLVFGTGASGTLWNIIDATGEFSPRLNGTLDLGSTSFNLRTGYFGTSVVTPIVGTGAASALSLSTSGGTQFRVDHIASAVNFLAVRGHIAGNNPQLIAAGSDANIGINYIAKGTGTHLFFEGSGGTITFEVAAAAGGRRVVVVGSAAGNPTITTNAGNLAITPNVVLGDSLTFSTAASKIVPGATSIALRNNADSADNVLVSDAGLMAVRTAVAIGAIPATNGSLRLANNEVMTSRNAANTANMNLILADGANVIRVADSAPSHLYLGPNLTGDILWGKPLVALGGGATPTFGTIGGSGPATAAQNSWMRVVDAGGAAFWVPAWK